MPTFNLGNGNDSFTARLMGSEVYGENGDDHIVVDAFSSLVDGGNGSDTIFVKGQSNTVSGGNGADDLTVSGLFNVVNGGNGADDITSITAFVGSEHPTRGGNVLTGGSGKDSFTLTNSNPLFVRHDGVVGDGDRIIAVIDQITDYSARELLAIGGANALSGPVGLGPDFHGERPLLLGDGDYAFFRGDLVGSGGAFDVNSTTGTDLLIVYDKADGVDDLRGGAVALLGFTDFGSVVIA